MLNRFLFLLVAIVSPAFSVAMLFGSPPDGVTLAERLPWVAFSLVAPAVLVAAMAEKNWDYSRPRWLHEQFGI